MGGKVFRGLAFVALAALLFVTSCQAWWVGGGSAVIGTTLGTTLGTAVGTAVGTTVGTAAGGAAQ